MAWSQGYCTLPLKILKGFQKKRMERAQLKRQVQEALDEIRPFLQADRGDISLLAIEGDTVKVRLEGACVKCSVNQLTLKSGVEMTIKKYAPQIERVINVQV
jgi:Fe-S cluster biogenesis protein NfuA